MADISAEVIVVFFFQGFCLTDKFLTFRFIISMVVGFMKFIRIVMMWRRI